MTAEATLGIVAGGIAIVLLLVGLSGIRVVYQYERMVVFILGRLIGAKGPGLFWVPPLISRTRKVDLRVVTIELSPQEGVTRDNVTVRVSAVVFFYIHNPNDAVTNVQDYLRATVQIAQTTLRSTLGQSTLDQLLSDREMINHSVQTVIDERTESWGIKVTLVEVKDVELPQSMQRAMAKQAEAEREKRAKVLLAQGEFLAAQTLADAAHLISTEPAAITLRYLQTLAEIAVEKNSTIVFPLPIDLVAPLTQILRRQSGAADVVPQVPQVPQAVVPTAPSLVAVEAAGANGVVPPLQS
jgi:regulator of protease activity HflC (stomatin/prohibitin superfamily)